MNAWGAGRADPEVRGADGAPTIPATGEGIPETRNRKMRHPKIVAGLAAAGLLAVVARQVPAQQGGPQGSAALVELKGSKVFQHTTELDAYHTVLQGITSATACEGVAALAARAGLLGGREDLLLGLANCLNVSDPEQQLACSEEVWESFEEDLEEVADVYDARLEVCELIGEDGYEIAIDPADFVDGFVDHPLFDLQPGSSWTYEKEGEDGLETIVVSVPGETYEILGVTCTVVLDTVYLLEDGEEGEPGHPIEETRDYYARHVDGSVWYMGEHTFELDEEGFIVSLDGQWIAGQDGAQPGVIMQAVPVAGVTYRQEFYLDEAEDVATILDVDATVDVDGERFEHCLQTEDWTPLEPDARELKSYSAEVGSTVLEQDVESGEQTVLVAFTRP